MFHFSVHLCAIFDAPRFYLIHFSHLQGIFFHLHLFLIFHTPNISLTSSLSSSPSLLFTSFSFSLILPFTPFWLFFLPFISTITLSPEWRWFSVLTPHLILPSFSSSCCLLSLLAPYFYFLIFIITVCFSSAGSMSEVLLILSGWSSVASTLMRKGTRCSSTLQMLALNTRMNFWDAPKGSSLLHWLTGRVNQLRQTYKFLRRCPSIHPSSTADWSFSSCRWVRSVSEGITYSACIYEILQ